MKAHLLALPLLVSVILFGACASGPGGPGGPGGPNCFGGGAQCVAFTDCCSGNCNNGVCIGGGPSCFGDGAGCNNSGECCSEFCTNQGICACLGPGNPCGIDQNCCSEHCHQGACM